MSSTALRAVIACLPLLCLGACVTTPVSDEAFLDSRQALADSLEAEQRYADALLQWKILASAYPDNPEVTAEVSRLESFIDQRIETLNADLESRPGREAESTWLKILALDPTHQPALTALRSMEAQRSYQAAEVKNKLIEKNYESRRRGQQQQSAEQALVAQANALQAEGDYEALLDLANQFIRQHEQHERALVFRFQALSVLGEEMLAGGEDELALEFFEQAAAIGGPVDADLQRRLNGLRQRLSARYYEDGMRVFRTDIDRSVELLQTSLTYNPDDLKVQRELSKAMRIQQNLKRINAKRKQPAGNSSLLN